MVRTGELLLETEQFCSLYYPSFSPYLRVLMLQPMGRVCHTYTRASHNHARIQPSHGLHDPLFALQQ
jgi:hypothetical protein